MFLSLGSNNVSKRLVALLAAAMLISAAVGVIADERQIAEIKIVGNNRVSSEAIMAAMGLQTGMPFSESAVEQAKQAIESMGFFQPGVTVGRESLEDGDRVIFTVVENPVVKSIRITGNTVVETDQLLSLMRTSVGSVLNTASFTQDIRAVEGFYEEQGYIAYVTEEIGIDPQTGELLIPLREVRIEDIRVVGNNKTKDYVILREMKQKPGDVYNIRQLYNDLQRIYDLDIFELEGVVPYRTEPGSDLGLVDIVIPVQEKRTGALTLGLGYSSKQRLVGQARVSEDNFRGRGEKVNLLWEQSGTRGSSYEVGYFTPWLDERQTSLGVNVYNKLIYRFSSNFLGAPTGSVNNYDERRRGGSVTLGRPLSDISRGFLTLRTESVDTRLRDFGGGFSVFNLNQDANINSGTFRFTSDTRDSQLDPYRGMHTSYALELGNTSFTRQDLGQAEQSISGNFVKYSIDARRYFSHGGPRQELDEQRRRVAVRVMAGSLSGDVPFFEQYFVGGAESLRGFKEDRFWGRNMLLASAEYRVPVTRGLTGVAFVDYGDAWGAPDEYRLRTIQEFDDDGNLIGERTGDLINDFAQHTGFQGNLGYGLGIRVQTPIGPLRLDYGFSTEGSRAHFSIGHVF